VGFLHRWATSSSREVSRSFLEDGRCRRSLVEDVACVIGAVGSLRDQDHVTAFLPPQRGFPTGRHRGRFRSALPAAAASSSGSNTAAVPRSHPYGGDALGVEPVLRLAGALGVSGYGGRRADGGRGGDDVIPALSLDGPVANRVRAFRVSVRVVVVDRLPRAPASSSRSTRGGASVTVIQRPPPPRAAAIGGRSLDHRPVLRVRLHPDDRSGTPRNAVGAPQGAGPRGPHGVLIGQDPVAGGALATPDGALVQALGVGLQEALLLGHGHHLHGPGVVPVVVSPAGRGHLRGPLPVRLHCGVDGRRPVASSLSPHSRGRGAVVLVGLFRDVDELRGAGSGLHGYPGPSGDAAAVAGQGGAGPRGQLGHVLVGIEASVRVGAGSELRAAVVLRVLGGLGGLAG